MVLDSDSVGALERFVRDDPIDETRALMDDLAAVGIGGHFLARKSTRRLHRAGEVWQPALWQRGPFEQYVGRPLVEDAGDTAQRLIAENDVEPLPDDVRRHVSAVVGPLDDYAKRLEEAGNPARDRGGNNVRPRFEYLSEAEKQFVHEQTVRLLEEVGVAYNTPTLTTLLKEAGATVDEARLRAKLPWDLVERCLRQVPRDILLAGRDPAYDCRIGDGGMLYTSDGAATYMLDDLTGERHEGTEADLAAMMCLYDAVPEIDFTWATITPGDVDSRVGNLEMARIAFEHSRKHLQDEVRTPDQAPVMIELLEAIAGAPLSERPIWSATNCTIAPLQHDAEMTEAHILMAKAGCPIFVLPMPQMGTTGPMSILGTSILNMAELLSAVVLFQLAAPGCAMVSAVGSAVAEMRSGLYLSGAPEDGLINVVCIEMSRFYGLRTQGSAVSCDAKACDLQAGAEGMLTGMASALAGADVMLAFGLMDSAQTASLAKTVLDADTVNAIERFMREDPVDEARALMDDLVEVGIGGHFLARRSTRELYRAGELWQPQLWHRGTFDQYVGTPLVKDAWDRAQTLIAENDVPPLPDDVRRHVREVIDAYASGKD